jgi:hypothetical protein
MKEGRRMRRARVDDVVTDAEQPLEELRRRVGWQVAAAYGLAPPEPEQEPVVDLPAPEPAPAPDLPEVPTLGELERLVARRGLVHPDRVEEWRWYLFYLRPFAGIDGRLPDSFRLLVRTVFKPLLAAASAERVQVGV